MAQIEQKIPAKEDVSQDLTDGYQYQLNNFEEEEYDCEFDLEEKYFEKLKEQRKRIEELSLLHQSYEQRLEKEIDKNRILREEVDRLSSFKDYHARYNESTLNLQVLAQENKSLKQQNDDLKQQIYQSSLDKTSLIQKLKLQVSLLRDKESSKIQSLEDELYAKQEELDRFVREFRGKEKEYQEQISSLRIKLSNVENEKDEAVRSEQRKVEKLEKELVYRSQSYSQSQITTDSLLKDSNRLKEESFRINGLLAAKDMQLKSLSQKYKKHMHTCRKQTAGKEKECQELKQTLRKYEKEVKQSSAECENIKIEMRKVKDSIEAERSRWEIDFSKEKSALQATIIQHSRTIEELLEIKNVLMAEKSKLQSILKKKTDCENKRLTFLKSEWKEINKLEKVIDKIID